jgi:Sulfotransferase family
MYAFIHIEKTGGSTLITILRRSFGTRHCDVRVPMNKRPATYRDIRPCVEAEDLRRVRRLYRNLRGISGHNVKPYADLHSVCPHIRFFTFLREPRKRFLSHFLNRSKCYTRQAFDAWVSESWVHNWQTKMLAGEPNAEKAIELLSQRVGFIGLTERFDESVVMLGRWLDEPGFRGEYRRVNQLSEKRRPRDEVRKQCDMSYLDSAGVRARIAEINAEDQKVYDFVTGTVYPRQLAAHRGDLESQVRELQQKNQGAGRLAEPLWPNFLRNCIYKPLLHCHAL